MKMTLAKTGDRNARKKEYYANESHFRFPNGAHGNRFPSTMVDLWSRWMAASSSSMLQMGCQFCPSNISAWIQAAMVLPPCKTYTKVYGGMDSILFIKGSQYERPWLVSTKIKSHWYGSNQSVQCVLMCTLNMTPLADSRGTDMRRR